MRFLRSISTRRLLALCAGAVAVAVATTAVAVAMSGGGPTPPPRPLADAVHDALTAPAIPGLSARIQFTNHLIGASSFQDGQGSDPILTGASGRLWASGDGKLRLELQSDGGGGDSQVLVDGKSFWVYDSGSDTVYRGTFPRHSNGAKRSTSEAPPSVAEIGRAIARFGKHATHSAAIPSDVAGQPTYTLRVAPSKDGGLLGGAELAWDAVHGTPLRAAIYARGNSSPVLQLEATDVSFGSFSSSVFDVSPPPGAKVVDLSPPSGAAPERRRAAPATVTGARAVGEQVGFQLSAPDSVAGMPRADVREIDVNGQKGALVTYGKGLGGIAVLESSAQTKGKGRSTPSGTPGGELNLPKVSINGAKGSELDTALGTVLRFSRSGVDYTVIGSVSPATAQAAARGL